MGNYRFRLADMMPNAWFYKLKDMNRGNRNQNQSTSHSVKRAQNPLPSPQKQPSQLPNKPTFLPSRPSYYFPSDSPLHHKASDTHFPLDPPRKSRHKARRKPIAPPRLVSSPISSNCACRLSTSESDSTPESFPLDQSCCCKITSSPTDIIIDVGANLELPPILTKPAKQEEEEVTKFDHKKSPTRKLAPGIHRLRMRANSPRLASRRVRAVQRSNGRRKGLAESFAVVKSSSDPKKDFRESMMEMIVENDLRTSKDLEELLACYLSLNSNEYHDVIVKVFEEIWFDITDTIRL